MTTRPLAPLTLVMAALSLATMTACIKKSQRLGVGTAGSDTILASIGGMDDNDDKRKNLVYQLLCDGDIKANGVVKDNKYVEFKEAALKEGLKCALEVKADADDFISNWYGVGSDGKAIIGLYYSSNFGVIKDRKLSLELYKLYSTPPKDPFWADLTVSFEKDTKIPADELLSANLKCGEKQYPAGSPVQITGEALQRTFTFKDLSVKELKDTECQVLTVLNDKKPGYKNSADDFKIVMDKASARKTISFGPIAVSAIESVEETIETTTTAGSTLCREFHNTTKKCTKIELPKTELIWMARVGGRDKDGRTEFRLVSGKAGLSSDNSLALKSIAEMEASIAAADGKFQFYAIADESKIVSEPLTAETVANLKKISAIAIADFTPEYFDVVYLHGFNEISESHLKEELKDRKSVHWIAKVAGTASDKVVNLLVTGSKKYFESEVVSGESLFSLEDYTKDDGTKFREYSYAEASNTLLSVDGCNTKQSYFFDSLGKSLTDDLKDDSKTHSDALDGCLFEKFDRSESLKDVTYKDSQIFLWGWDSIKLAN